MGKLGLGTVQFGLDYGISNPEGRTPVREVAAILDAAHRAGVEVLDTAHEYGDSQRTIGEVLAELGFPGFRVITKTPAFLKDPIRPEDARFLLEAFRASLALLRLDRVDGLLVHLAEDLLVPGAHLLYEAMRGLRSAGQVRVLGVSVYTTSQLLRVLERYDIDLVQLPINILNQSFVREGVLEKLASRGIEVHGRSIFLQGLLCMDIADLPSYFAPILPTMRKLDDFLRSNGLSAARGALGFVNQHPEVSTLLIGVNHPAQLLENLDHFRRVQGLSLDFSAFHVEDERMTNPYLWERAGR